MDTSGFSMWREHLLATGMEMYTCCSQGFSSPVIRQFVPCFLFFNLSGTPQLCRAWSVSQHPLKCAELSLSFRVPHPRMPSKSATFVLPLQSLCGVRTAMDSVCPGSVSLSGGSQHFLSSQVWRNRSGVVYICHLHVSGGSDSEINIKNAAGLTVVFTVFFVIVRIR